MKFRIEQARRLHHSAQSLQMRISEGEGMHLDFKYHIDDAARIARSLSAFANSEGGSLLVGVKDNGKVVGVRTSEELYVVESANDRHLRPSLPLCFEEWRINGKTVLEVHVPPAKRKPVFVWDTDRKWRAYLRRRDHNIRAPRPWVEGMHRRYRSGPRRLSYTPALRRLVQWMREAGGPATLRQMHQGTRLPTRRLLDELAALIAFDLVEVDFEAVEYTYRLREASHPLFQGAAAG